MAESSLIENLIAYTEQQMLLGVPLRVMVRPLLGLFAGRQGARQWRRLLSDSQFLKDAKPELLEQAWRCLL
jgi:tRNA-dihydrouridine synthase A